MSLGRLYYSQGHAVEGRNFLNPAFEAFTEGFGTPDLKRAKALLKEWS